MPGTPCLLHMTNGGAYKTTPLAKGALVSRSYRLLDCQLGDMSTALATCILARFWQVNPQLDIVRKQLPAIRQCLRNVSWGLSRPAARKRLTRATLCHLRPGPEMEPHTMREGTRVSIPRGRKGWRNTWIAFYTQDIDKLFVYVIAISGGQYARVKIGIAADPLKRLAQLQTAQGQPLILCHAAWFPGESQARDIEGRMHDELSRWRCKGGGSEWFDTKVLRWVSRHASHPRWRDMNPACAEFYDKRFKGTPVDVLEAVAQHLQRTSHG